MEAQPLVCFPLAWLYYKQGRASTAPPQGQLPSRGLAPLSPALTHCCPSRRKRPHPAGWILSSRGKLRKKERRGEKGRKRPPGAELRLQCTVMARRGQQTQNLDTSLSSKGGCPPNPRAAFFSFLFFLSFFFLRENEWFIRKGGGQKKI